MNNRILKPITVATLFALAAISSATQASLPDQNHITGGNSEAIHSFTDYTWIPTSTALGKIGQAGVIFRQGASATISNISFDTTSKGTVTVQAADSSNEKHGFYGGRVAFDDNAVYDGFKTISITGSSVIFGPVNQDGDGAIRFFGGYADIGTTTSSITVNDNHVVIGDASTASSLYDAEIAGAKLNFAGAPNPDQYTVFSLANNRVTLTNLSVHSLDVTGAYTPNGDVSDNKIVLDGVTVSDDMAINMLAGGTTGYGSAANNSIEISNSVIAEGTMVLGGKNDSANAKRNTGNRVTIGENVTGPSNSRLSLYQLYGGHWGQSTQSENPDASVQVADGLNNNYLTLCSPVSTRYFGGVQHFEFFLNSDLISSNEAVLEVTGNKVLLEPNQSTITVATVGSAQLSGGDSVKLIDSTNGFVKSDGTALAASDLSNIGSADVTLANHVSLARVESTQLAREDYDLLLQDNDTSLVLQIKQDETGTDPGTEPGGDVQPGTDTINPETDVLMQASIASLASLYASDDLLVDTALKSRAGKRLSGPFAAARAGTWSNDASSRFDSDVYSGLLGWAFSAANVEFGPFIEMGRGNYEMSQGAEGHHNYVGAGVYANWQTPFYVRLTGYIKGGAMENNFHTSLVGQNVDFDNTTAYWGAHLGMNLDIDLTEKLRARPFLSYFYDRRESDSFTQEGAAVDGATFNFDTINAHRVQLGAMFEYAYSETARPYFGITYEHVIKAEAKGTAVDSQGQLSLNSSDIEGATGIVSAGWSYVNPTQEFEFNFGVNGYGGTRNGVSAQMSANWLF